MGDRVREKEDRLGLAGDYGFNNQVIAIFVLADPGGYANRELVEFLEMLQFRIAKAYFAIVPDRGIGPR